MMGVTTPGGQGVQARLEAAGYETIVFHANGAGGMALEELIGQGEVDGVVDLTTNELTSELYGGILSAGPARLTMAGRLGIPQVVAPGALDVINFGPAGSIPARFAGPDRRLVIHSASVTSVRASREESAEIGARFAERAQRRHRPDGRPAAAARMLAVRAARRSRSSTPRPTRRSSGPSGAGLRPDIPCADVDANINDPAFAEAATRTFLSLWEASLARDAGATA